MNYYLVVKGQPRDNKGKFKGSACVVTGPYIGSSVIPLPMDYLSDYGNRREKIYRTKREDIHLFIKDISKDAFVKGYF
jgi:hypothetical protein